MFRLAYTWSLGAKGIPKFVEIDVMAGDYTQYTIELEDDVSSWLVGDEIVIASTDYDYEQAER